MGSLPQNPLLPLNQGVLTQTHLYPYTKESSPCQGYKQNTGKSGFFTELIFLPPKI